MFGKTGGFLFRFAALIRRGGEAWSLRCWEGVGEEKEGAIPSTPGGGGGPTLRKVNNLFYTIKYEKSWNIKINQVNEALAGENINFIPWNETLDTLSYKLPGTARVAFLINLRDDHKQGAFVDACFFNWGQIKTRRLSIYHYSFPKKRLKR